MFCFIVFGCQYECNLLPRKTRLRTDLLCVESLTHSLTHPLLKFTARCEICDMLSFESDCQNSLKYSSSIYIPLNVEMFSAELLATEVITCVLFCFYCMTQL